MNVLYPDFDILPRNLKWNLKIDPWKRRFLLETIIFRGYVSFGECTPLKINMFYLRITYNWRGENHLPSSPLWVPTCSFRRVIVLWILTMALPKKTTKLLCDFEDSWAPNSSSFRMGKYLSSLATSLPLGYHRATNPADDVFCWGPVPPPPMAHCQRWQRQSPKR